jgi:hypothetical protein
MLIFVGVTIIGGLGCDGGWVTQVPTAQASADPYEDVYRLLSTAKMFGNVPARVDVSETVVTLNRVTSDSVITRAIPFAQADVQLKHDQGRDKWVVDVYGSDGKLIVRLESPDGSHANELATVLETLKTIASR